MKIGIDIREANTRDGKGVYTLNLVKALLENDKENSYILYTKNPIPEFPNAKTIKGRGLNWHLKVLKDIKKQKLDIFFAPTSYIIPAFIPKNIKSIITVHDLIAFLYPKKHNTKAVLLEKLLLKRAVKKAQKILTVSNNTRHDLLKKFHPDENKIDTVYCAVSSDMGKVETGKVQEFKVRRNLPEKFFLSVGTIIPRKNYVNLIRAFAMIKEGHLVIVGRKAWGTREIFDEVYKKDLQNRITFLDSVDQEELNLLYNAAQALVFPSFYEGFGIPPLEAFKCGCPVIASNVSSIPEVVGDAATLVDPNSPEEISEAMQKIITDKNLRENLIQKGLIQSKKFSWQDSAKKLLTIFKEI